MNLVHDILHLLQYPVHHTLPVIVSSTPHTSRYSIQYTTHFQVLFAVHHTLPGILSSSATHFQSLYPVHLTLPGIVSSTTHTSRYSIQYTTHFQVLFTLHHTLPGIVSSTPHTFRYCIQCTTHFQLLYPVHHTLPGIDYVQVSENLRFPKCVFLSIFFQVESLNQSSISPPHFKVVVSNIQTNLGNISRYQFVYLGSKVQTG